MAESTTHRPVDAAALRRGQRRAAAAAQPPWLHGEVARRMAARLAILRQPPKVVVDWWAGPGGSASALSDACPGARILPVAVPGAAPAEPQAVPWWSARRWRAAPTPAAADSIEPGSAQMVWANMMLHAVADPAAEMAAWRRLLAVDGCVMFSTVGPDTLRSLRELYAEAGWGEPHAPFVDMHDLGDMLVHGGFADPVMDQERIVLTWASPQALRAELRTLGGNASPARFAGLRTPRWRARLDAALARRAGAEGRIALEFEIVYGHAFNPMPRLRAQSETRVGVDELQRMARAGRRGESLG